MLFKQLILLAIVAVATAFPVPPGADPDATVATAPPSPPSTAIPAPPPDVPVARRDAEDQPLSPSPTADSAAPAADSLTPEQGLRARQGPPPQQPPPPNNNNNNNAQRPGGPGGNNAAAAGNGGPQGPRGIKRADRGAPPGPPPPNSPPPPSPPLPPPPQLKRYAQAPAPNPTLAVTYLRIPHLTRTTTLRPHLRRLRLRIHLLRL